MTLIEWREEYSIGIEEIDFEHRQMIDLINDSFEATGADASTARLLDCLGEIFARISAHFALEEELMRSSRYDEYQEHKDDHERLLDSLRDIMDDVINRGFDHEQLAKRLEEWFRVHFREKDARLHHHLE